MQFTNIKEVDKALQAINEMAIIGRAQKTPSFYRPYHFVLFALTAKKCGWQDLHMTDEDKKFVAYASRMNLWDVLDFSTPVIVNRHNEAGRFHPLTKLDDPESVEQVSKKLSLLFEEDGNESVRAIDIAVVELVGNAFAHSDITSGLRGLVCAQKWPSGKKAQIAIGDFGIGIRCSLKSSNEYLKLLDQKNACELATGYEVTSKRGKNHSGYGLTLTKELIQKNGGNFILASGDEYFCINSGNAYSGNFDSYMPGTLVVLEWNTDIPLSARKVYDGWSAIEGDKDDFDF